MNVAAHPRRLLSAPPAGADLGPAFDEALDRLADLARLLGQVRAMHRPYRRVRWSRCRCAGCGQPYPCPTLRATAPRVCG